MKKQIQDTFQQVYAGITPGEIGNGVVIDRANFRTALIHLAVGTMTAATCKLKIQHGNLEDGSDMTDYQIDAVTVETDELTSSDTQTTLELDLAPLKPFMRVVEIETGTVANFNATVVLGDQKFSTNW